MDLVWKPEYNIEFGAIDYQHKRLFKILGDAKEKIATQKNRPEAMAGSLEELVNYGKEHFVYEEGLMREGKYPDLDTHIKLHNDFFDEVGRYQQRCLDGSIKVSEVMVFIFDWLMVHMLEEDFKYKKHLEESGFKIDELSRLSV